MLQRVTGICKTGKRWTGKWRTGKRRTGKWRTENDGLENDGVEEQTYILHTMKNFNVYDISTNLKTYIIPHLELYLLKYDKQKKSYNGHSTGTSCIPVL